MYGLDSFGRSDASHAFAELSRNLRGICNHHGRHSNRIGAELGFEHVVANRLDIADGRIAGTVAAPILTRDSKHDTLLQLAQRYGVPPMATLAIGDGANDLPMLDAAGLGIAFHAKPAVAAASRWRLDHADLTGVLFAQGYRQEEIVEPRSGQ